MPLSHVAVCAAALLLAAASGKPPQISKEELAEREAKAAAVRAEGDEMIARARAQDLFVNETKEGAILIRHKASNFQCLFNPGAENDLLVLKGEHARGEDIGCDGPTMMMFHSSYAITRAAPGETLDSAFEASVAATKAKWPDAVALKVKHDPNQEVLERIAAQAPPSRTGWYMTKIGPNWVFSRLSVAKVGDWIVSLRASGPVDAQAQSESLTEMLWVTRLAVMTDLKLGGRPVVADARHKAP